jgi:hypothetical protein
LIELEFDTRPERGAPLGDIASSLVSLHDLLRDLAALAADPANVEFREIQVVAIEMRRPLTITLSLFAISAEAVKAFQEICRDIILCRDPDPHHRAPAGGGSEREAARQRLATALDLVLRADGKDGQLTEKELQRLHGHITTLRRADVPLKRVIVRG